MTLVSVNVKIATDATGALTEIPVLLTAQGVLQPLLDYCLSRHHDRSRSWQKKVVRDTMLFLRYVLANPDEPLSRRLFRNFAQRLYSGTFDLTTGVDTSNLCWHPLSYKNAGEIIFRLSEFFEWLGQDSPMAATLNPRYTGSLFDQRLDEAAYTYRRDRAFLGHTWIANLKPAGRNSIRPKRDKDSLIVRSNPPAFPDERFEELLFRGFKVRGRLDYRGILICLLMHGGGLRVSEPFHLYVQDVFPSPENKKSATVIVHHPYLGLAPDEVSLRSPHNRKINRATYLAEEFGLPPRTEILNSRAAGWKDPRTDDGHNYMRVYWFQPYWGEIFLQVWYRYLEQLIRVERQHPFAFVNLYREPFGNIYTIDKFVKAHRAAIQRIGLEPCKAAGTTPHGHRHAYGRRLKNAGVDSLILQRCMHHRSEESQRIYTQPTTNEIISALVAANGKIQPSIKNFDLAEAT